MKHFTILFFFLAWTISQVQGQYSDLNTNLIPDSLKKNANAVVRYDRTIVDLSSKKKMIVQVEYAATAFNERGKSILAFSKSYKEGSSQIKDIELEIIGADGSTLREIKKKEIDDFAAFDGYSLISDARRQSFGINSKDYPITVKYSYRLESKNTLSIPGWYPIVNYGVAVEQSRYQLIHPDQSINHKAYQYKAKPISEGATTVFELKQAKALTKERYAPHFTELAPHVIFSPTTFIYEGYQGNYTNWQEYGAWVHHSLLDKRDNLDKTLVKAELDKIITETDNKKEIARQIYDYVQENTRYISISLDEGGVQPMLCQDVHDQKYGDCKALSYYMRSLLSLYDIPANYVEVYADSDFKKSYDPTFASITQGNHIILNIPLDQDTVWLDCTSHDLPFDFLGSFSDDRTALIINEQGGELVRTPAYDHTHNRTHYDIKSKINQEGGITSSFSYTLTGVPMSQRLHMKNKEPHLKEKFLKEDFLSSFKRLQLIDHDYHLNESDLSSTEEISLSSEHYGEIAGKYILIPTAFQSMKIPRFKKKKKRRYSIHIHRAYSEESQQIVTLPAGYTLYGDPHKETISSPYGTYDISYELNQEGDLVISRSLVVYKGEYENSDYKTIKKFFDRILQEEKRQITLTLSS